MEPAVTVKPRDARVIKVANVIIPAADQDRAAQFYTEALGLEKRVDLPFGDGSRYIEVAPAGTETPIALCPPGPGVTPGGKDTGISLQADDIDAYHAQLKDLGVDVDAEVSHFGDAVPPLFWFRDPEGNRLMVVEAR
jgi:predicted enzyme related to lactoylglutathione lyase